MLFYYFFIFSISALSFISASPFAITWNFYKGILAIGINTEYFIDSNIKIGGGATYERIVNPLYNIASEKYDVWNNFQLCFSAKYIF